MKFYVTLLVVFLKGGNSPGNIVNTGLVAHHGDWYFTGIQAVYRYSSNLAVTLKDMGELVGTADFTWWCQDQRKAELGYCFAKEHWGKASARVMEKAGMIHEGLMRDAILRDDFLKLSKYVDFELEVEWKED